MMPDPRYWLVLITFLGSCLGAFAQIQYFPGQIQYQSGETASVMVPTNFTRLAMGKSLKLKDEKGKKTEVDLRQAVMIEAVNGPRLQLNKVVLPGDSTETEVWTRIYADGTVKAAMTGHFGKKLYLAGKKDQNLVVLNPPEMGVANQYGRSISGTDDRGLQVGLRSVFGECDATFSLLNGQPKLSRQFIKKLALTYNQQCGESSYADKFIPGLDLMKLRVLAEYHFATDFFLPGEYSNISAYGIQTRLVFPRWRNDIFFDIFFRQVSFDVQTNPKVVSDAVSAVLVGFQGNSRGPQYGFRFGYQYEIMPKMRVFAAVGLGESNHKRDGFLFQRPLGSSSSTTFTSSFREKELTLYWNGAVGLDYKILPFLVTQIEAGANGYQYLALGVGYEFGIR